MKHLTLTDRFMTMFHIGLAAKSLRHDAEPEPLMYLDRGEVVAPKDEWANTDVWAAQSRKAVGR